MGPVSYSWYNSRRCILSRANVTLVDYGIGNLQAFFNIYSRLNVSIDIASTPEELSCAKRIILPGVGAFDWAMTRLIDSGLREMLDDLVLRQHVPVLGVCVGMQIMAKNSQEGVIPGLGWLDAKVKHFNRNNLSPDIHFPHMGWNDVEPAFQNELFANIIDPRFYFLHSYYFSPANLMQTLATTEYGIQFTSAAVSGNIYGVQFHPEKSHSWGIQLLRNFSEI